MRQIRRVISNGLALAGLVSVMAVAEPSPGGLDQAKALYEIGAYAEAADTANAAGTPDGYALAARAVAAAAILDADPAHLAQHADTVRAYAQAALRKDPDHVGAQLQLAIAIWLEGRTAGAMESYVRGLPAWGRDILVAALADAAPGSLDAAWAHALMGGWHLEVLRRGGARGARWYGADEDRGVRHLAHALRLAPDDPAIAVQCAVSYLAYDAERYGAFAEAALEQALAADPGDAFSAAMLDKARAISGAMDAKNAAVVDRLVLAMVEG